MKFVALLALLYCSATLVRAALTGVPQYGYVATQYTGNLPGLTFGMAWRDDGTMIVARNAALCSVPPGGGVCTPLPQGNYQAHGLTRDLEGNFWGAFINIVFQFDPFTGAKLKTITGTGATHDIHVDPISGDLFVSDPNGLPNVSRLTRISGQNTANPVITQNYGDLGADRVDGFAITSDGTFYMAGFNNDQRIHIMPPTNSPNAGISYIAHPSVISALPDGIATQPNPNGGTPYIFVNTNAGGVLRIKYDAPQEMVVIANGGTRGDFSRVGPDGCLYVTTISEIYRITGEGGLCNFDAGSPPPEPEHCTVCSNTITAAVCATLPNADGC